MGLFDEAQQLSAPTLPSIDNSQPNSGSGLFNAAANIKQQPQQVSGQGLFGSANDTVKDTPAMAPDSTATLKSISLSHPLESAFTTFHGALDDIGTLTSGLANIAYTPIRIVSNLLHGEGDPFKNTIVSNFGDLAAGAFNDMAGNEEGVTPAWNAMKAYYSQYGTHPIDMIANHPINTLLDLASVFDLGATSFGAISRTGTVGELLESASAAQKAGDFAKATDLALEARKLQSASTSGRIASTLETVQKGINPFRLGGQAIGGTMGFLGSKIPALDAFNTWAQSLFSRTTKFGLNPGAESDQFFKVTDQLRSQTELYNQKFREAIEPALQPLINNPALADRIAEGLDRPSLLTDPYEIALKDSIQQVFNEHVTDPERAGGMLKNFIDGGYLEHVYESDAPKGFFGKLYKSFTINAPNDKAAQILRFDPLAGEAEPLIGTADYNSLSEVNKDAEIEKIERHGSSEIDGLQKENLKLTKGVFDNQLSDLLEERKDLLRQKAELTERKITHPEDFQTSLGDLGNALDIQEKVTKAKLVESNLKLQDEIARLKAKYPDGLPDQTKSAGKLKFAEPDDKLVYNLRRIEQIQNEIADNSKPYNTNLRLFKNKDGQLLSAIRPTRSELMSIGMKPKDLIDSLDHRMKTSAMNQAKLKLGDQLGQEFGQLQKPEAPVAPNGEKWVKSTSIRTPDGQFYYLPQNIEDAAKQIFVTSAKGDAAIALHGVSELFKRLLFVNPESAAVHEIHLAYLGALGGVNPIDIFRTVQGIREGDAVAAEFNRQVGQSGFKNFFEPQTESLKESVNLKNAGVVEKAKTYANPMNKNFLGMNVSSNILANTDEFLRQIIYRKGLRQGLTTDEAISKANSFMGNYSNLTPFERQLQSVFPFYNWMKQSIPVSARALTDQAAKLDFFGRFANASSAFNPNDSEKTGKIDSGFKDEKGNEIYLNLPIPLKDVRNLFADAPSFMWARMNPGITVPVSLASNQKNPFNTDPNFSKLNRVYDPESSKVGNTDIKAELNFTLGQIANPFRILSDQSGTTDTGGFTKKVLEGMGIYESSYDPKKTDYYQTKDALEAVKTLSKEYQTAIKAHNLQQASFYQRSIQLWQDKIQGR